MTFDSTDGAEPGAPHQPPVEPSPSPVRDDDDLPRQSGQAPIITPCIYCSETQLIPVGAARHQCDRCGAVCRWVKHTECGTVTGIWAAHPERVLNFRCPGCDTDSSWIDSTILAGRAAAHPTGSFMRLSEPAKGPSTPRELGRSTTRPKPPRWAIAIVAVVFVSFIGYAVSRPDSNSSPGTGRGSNDPSITNPYWTACKNQLGYGSTYDSNLTNSEYVAVMSCATQRDISAAETATP